MTVERWLPVPEAPHRYQVSDQGRVWSNISDRILRPATSQWGYPIVCLAVAPGVYRKRVIHQLVLNAFVGPRPDGMITRHLDGNPTNNTLNNLRWGTQVENAQDRIRHGRDPQLNQVECTHGHPLDDDNTVWRKNGTRACRECLRRRGREWIRAKRAAARREVAA